MSASEKQNNSQFGNQLLPPEAVPQTVEKINAALKRIGYIINDAPYRGEERDGAWQAFLENRKLIEEAVRLSASPSVPQTVELPTAIDVEKAVHAAYLECRECLNVASLSVEARRSGEIVMTALKMSRRFLFNLQQQEALRLSVLSQQEPTDDLDGR